MVQKEALTSGRSSRAGRFAEQGSSMAWTALVLAFLLLPLMTLLVDGGRLLTIRNRLQTAADAACEDAAWSAADFAEFRSSGKTSFQHNWYWIGRAQATFHQTLSEQAALEYSASIDIQPDFDSAYMNCSARARVPLLSGGGAVASPVVLHAGSASRIRFRSTP